MSYEQSFAVLGHSGEWRVDIPKQKDFDLGKSKDFTILTENTVAIREDEIKIPFLGRLFKAEWLEGNTSYWTWSRDGMLIGKVKNGHPVFPAPTYEWELEPISLEQETIFVASSKTEAHILTQEIFEDKLYRVTLPRKAPWTWSRLLWCATFSPWLWFLWGGLILLYELLRRRERASFK